jgi:tRNA nucleotidyltransferase/poly(A) polymerase
MNNYIKRILQEKIKLIHYKENSDVILDYSEQSLKFNYSILKDNNAFIVYDLLHNTYISKESKELKELITNLSNKFRKYVVLESSKILKEVTNILNISENSYFVGGTVRDILIDRIPKDYDFCTDIPYEELSLLFKKQGFKTIESGKNFLVLNVQKDNQTFEIANFRKDSNNINGRNNTSVQIGTIYEDAERRDFYINSLYINTKTFEIEDPTSYGIEDLLSNKLRFVGNPKDRLKDDYLRAIRFYKFMSRGFEPHPSHLKIVREMFSECISNTSHERIRTELESIIKGCK